MSLSLPNGGIGNFLHLIVGIIFLFLYLHIDFSHCV